MADSKSGPPAFEVHYVPSEFSPETDIAGYSDEDDIVSVISVGDPFMYVIPSFDVKIRGYSRKDGKGRNLDLFVRNDGSLCQTYPSIMAIRNVTIIKVWYRINILHITLIKCFGRKVNFKCVWTQLGLSPQGVMVVWEWEWLDDEIDHISETSSEGIAAINPALESCSEGHSDDECSLNSQSATHTVTFKCIGTTHDAASQQTLQKVSGFLHKGEQSLLTFFQNQIIHMIVRPLPSSVS